MYAQVHHGNSWTWEAGTVIERIGKVNYNVFLKKRRRLICSHANQLKERSGSSSKTESSPLSVFFDGFGLPNPVVNPIPSPVAFPVVDPVPSPVPFNVPEQSTNDLLGSDFSESDQSADECGTEADVAEDQPSLLQEPDTPVAEPVQRPSRLIQLPARFNFYWMLRL